MRYLTFAIVSIACILLLLTVFIHTFPSPLIKPNSIINITSSFLPQGWGFFTKSPRDVRTEAYYWKEPENLIQPNFSAQYYFGISKLPQRINFEIGQSLKQVRDSNWHKTFDIYNNFDNGMFYAIKPIFKNPILKGKVLIINKERLPWAWANFEKGIKGFPLIYTKINIP